MWSLTVYQRKSDVFCRTCQNIHILPMKIDIPFLTEVISAGLWVDLEPLLLRVTEVGGRLVIARKSMLSSYST